MISAPPAKALNGAAVNTCEKIFFRLWVNSEKNLPAKPKSIPARIAYPTKRILRSANRPEFNGVAINYC